MTEPSPNVIRPRAYWYGISFLVLVLGIGLAAWQIGSTVTKIQSDLKQVRGEGIVELSQPGSYSYFVSRGASKRMDAAANQAWANAEHAHVMVVDEQTGSQIEIRRVYETADLHNTLVARLAEFHVPGPGKYRVQTNPPLHALNPSVRPTMSVQELGEEAMSMAIRMGIAVGIGSVAVLLSAAMLLIVFLFRRSSKKRQSRTQVASAPVADQ